PFIGASINGHSSSDTAIGGSGIAIPAGPANRLLPGVDRPFTTKAYATVDLRLGYEAADGRWRAMVFGRNVFNTYYWTNVITSSDATARFAGRPATYGVTLGFKI